jgi:hypothetical protein
MTDEHFKVVLKELEEINPKVVNNTNDGWVVITIKEGRFKDTNKLFVQPDYDYRIDNFAIPMLYHANEIQKLWK